MSRYTKNGFRLYKCQPHCWAPIKPPLCGSAIKETKTSPFSFAFKKKKGLNGDKRIKSGNITKLDKIFDSQLVTPLLSLFALFFHFSSPAVQNTLSCKISYFRTSFVVNWTPTFLISSSSSSVPRTSGTGLCGHKGKVMFQSCSTACKKLKSLFYFFLTIPTLILCRTFLTFSEHKTQHLPAQLEKFQKKTEVQSTGRLTHTKLFLQMCSVFIIKYF